jgi:hypothetical protein
MAGAGAKVWQARVHEDGSFSVMGRAVSLEGSGEETRHGEGNLLQQADVSSVTCKVYSLGTDPNSLAGTEVTPAPTLTPAANLYDALQTLGWDADLDGYNFRHDVGPDYVPNPNEFYLLEYKLTLSGGGVVWGKVRVKTLPTRQS